MLKSAVGLLLVPLAAGLLLPSAAPKSHVTAAHVAAAPLQRAPQPVLKLSNPFRFTLSTRTYLALNNLDGLLVKPAVKLGTARCQACELRSEQGEVGGKWRRSAGARRGSWWWAAASRAVR